MKEGDEVPVDEAVAMLAQRVAALEVNSCSNAGGTPSDASSLAWGRMVADLKALRTFLVTATSEVAELETVKAENAKLKYRIKHLLKAIEDGDSGDMQA